LEQNCCNVKGKRRETTNVIEEIKTAKCVRDLHSIYSAPRP